MKPFLAVTISVREPPNLSIKVCMAADVFAMRADELVTADRIRQFLDEKESQPISAADSCQRFKYIPGRWKACFCRMQSSATKRNLYIITGVVQGHTDPQKLRKFARNHTSHVASI